MSAWRAYLALLVFMPLPFGGNTDWAWPLYSACSIGLLLWHWRQQPEATVPLQNSRWMLAVLALVQVWVLIQALIVSEAPYDTFAYFLKGAGLTAFFALSLLLINTKARVGQVVWAVILSAAFQAFYGSMMVMTGVEFGFFEEKTHYRKLVTGTFINRNHVAGYLEMALALGIGLLMAQSTQYHGSLRQRVRQAVEMLLSSKVVLRLLLAMLVIALVMTRSRMGNTAFFASMTIAGVLALFLMRNKSRSTTILLASLLIIDIAIVGTFFGVGKVAERLQKTSQDTESRDEVTRDTFYMWQEQPLTGFGAGSYETAFPQHKSVDITLEPLYNHAHNDYLQFLVEYGALAFGAMLAVVIAAIWNGIQAMRTRRSDIMKGMGFASVMGLTAIGIHSAVDFNLQIPANAWLFVLLLALASVARWAPHESEGSGSKRRRRSNA